jgi:hypothetical protein
MLYRTHLRFKHAIHYSDVEVPCGQEFRPSKFTSFAALLRHFQKCHSHILQSNDDACDPCENEQAESTLSNSCETVGDSSSAGQQDHLSVQNIATDNDPLNITDACMNFLGSLQAKSNMTRANIQAVTENLQVLLSDVAEFSQPRVKTLCQEVEIECKNPSVARCLDNLSGINKAVEPIATAYRRDQYLTKSGFFIRPLQIVLGSRTETIFCKGWFSQNHCC